MNFSENLQFLRKKQNLTQEQLAEQLDVSRQAVSKWESAQSYPEMDKLLALCKLFSCQLNDLVQGNVQDSFIEDTAHYNSFYNRYSIAIASGIAMILLAVSGMLHMENMGFESQGTFLLMLVVAVAVFLFVITGIKMEYFKKKHPHITDFYTEDQRDAFHQRYAIAMASGVALILLGAAFVAACEFIAMSDDRANVIFMLCVTIAVPVFVYFELQKEKYDVAHYNQDSSGKSSKKYQSASEKACSVIMLFATAIFLAVGLVWNLWHPGWVVFPIGGVLCAIASILLSKGTFEK